MTAPSSSGAVDVEHHRERLQAVRTRTLALVSGLDATTLRKQLIPILSPMVWDLGHIANYEETWIAQEVLERPPVSQAFQEMFDPVRNPRPVREALPLPERDGLLGYLARVRERTEEALSSLGDLSPRRLLDDGFVFHLIAEHEEQHQETLLQAMQLLEDPPYAPPERRSLPPGSSVEPEMIRVPTGRFSMGRSATQGFSYDNEKPQHEIEVGEFEIDRFPTTNRQFLEFVEDGGYRREELWSAEGWEWLGEFRFKGERIAAPQNWYRDGDAWYVRYADKVEPASNNRPVIHIGYFEAEAFARWAGKRLPTESEWERAALSTPEGEHRVFPWGDERPTVDRANLDQLAFAPAEIGAYPRGASAWGVEQMIGDVWEWTSTDFRGYPGFEAFPYAEYSEIFFGDEYKVLRGGSWATRPHVARGTFRNWDFPIRRQIFAGVRCARGG